MTADAPELPLRERKTNIAMIVVTVLPFIGLLLAVTMSWNEAVGPTDLLLFFGLYVVCGFGITIGFHRMLTHRAFQVHKPTRYLFAIMGSMSVQGPVIDWVADHRKHHAHTDVEGDPHSPHVGHGDGVSGALRGLWHAHAGWLWETHGQARAHNTPRTSSRIAACASSTESSRGSCSPAS